MADGVVQWIRLMLDKGSVAQTTADANVAGAQIGAAAAQGVASKGEQAGRDMIARLVKTMQEGAAEIKQQVANGLKTEDEGRAAGQKLGRTFVAELTKSLSGMKAMGLITEEEFKRLQASAVPALQAIRSEFTKVEAAEASAGEHTGFFAQQFERLAVRMAEYFAIREVIEFGKHTVDAFDDIQSEMNRASATLANYGMSFHAVKPEIDAHVEAMGKLGIKSIDYYRTFNMLLGLTGDYKKALNGADAAMNLSITSGKSSEETARAIGKAYDGSTTSLQRYGIVLDKHKDIAQQINDLTGEQAKNHAAGFAGSVGRIAVEWENFQVALGQAITQMGGGTSVIDILVAGIQGLTQWVKTNADVIRELGKVGLGVFQVLGAGVKLLGILFSVLRAQIAYVAYGVDTTSAAFQSFGSAALFVVGKVLEGIGFLFPAASKAGDDLLALSTRLHNIATQHMDENRKALAQTLDDIRSGKDKLGDIPVTEPDTGNNKPPHRPDKTPKSHEDSDLTHEIELLGKGLLLDDQRAASAKKLDELQAELNKKLQQHGLTLEQEIRLQDHLKEIEKARETPDAALGQEITTLRDRLTINAQDADARTRLVAIQAELLKRQQDTTKSALEQYNVNKLLVQVNGALAKDTIGPLQQQVALLHEMSQFADLHEDALQKQVDLEDTIAVLLRNENLSLADQIALRKLLLDLQKDTDPATPVKDLEKQAGALISTVNTGRTQRERDTALAALRKLDAQLTELAKANEGDAATLARINAAKNKVEKVLDEHPLTAKGFFKDIHDTLETTLPAIAKSAASDMVDSFENGFSRIIRGTEDIRGAVGGMFKGMAAGLAKELADVAKLKAKENLANAVQYGAMAIGEAFHNPAAAAADAKAALGFLAAAAEWATLGGIAGSAAGGGSGGGTQPGNVGGQTAANMTPAGPQMILHIDGIDPKNTRHQELAGMTIQQYAQRAGATFILGAKS